VGWKGRAWAGGSRERCVTAQCCRWASAGHAGTNRQNRGKVAAGKREVWPWQKANGSGGRGRVVASQLPFFCSGVRVSSVRIAWW